jgi:hypothetical protein
MATDANGCTGEKTFTMMYLGFGTETIKPRVRIVSPANNSVQSSASMTVTGTANDSGKPLGSVAQVLYSLNGAPWQVAGNAYFGDSVSNWSATVNLQPGLNSFVAQALDPGGNVSPVATNFYFYGSPGNVFGTYNGLFYEINDFGAPAISERSAGAVLNVTVQLTRVFSGKIYVGGANYPLKGSFDLGGNSAVVVNRAAPKGALSVNLHLDWSGTSNQITGTVSCAEEEWTAPLLAELATHNTGSSYAGRYTMVIPPAADAPDHSPGGYCYGLISVTGNGMVSMNGSALADSTAISQSVAISKHGHWPLYVDLYNHRGLLEGWIDFTSGALIGQVTWIKPASVTSVTYPSGFTNIVATSGSVYAPAAPAMSTGDGLLDITGVADFNLPMTFDVGVNANNKLANLSQTNLLSGSITKATGLITVNFRPTGIGPVTKTAKGVVLQSSNAAYGTFIGITNIGAIHLH